MRLGKKLLLLLCVVSVLTASLCEQTLCNASADSLKYDLNSDGKVNLADLSILLRVNQALEDDPSGKCDLNGDRRVNLSDYNLLRDYIISIDGGLIYDLNIDGRVDSLDLSILYNYLFGNKENAITIINCAIRILDISGDGNIDFSDYELLKGYIATHMSAINLALGKVATASEYVNDETPQKAVNGTYSDLSDKWCTGWSSKEKWLKIDLGGLYEINRWIVCHAGVYESWHPEYNTRDFRLQYSEDGTNWTTADTVTQNTANVTDRRNLTFLARYVRLYIDYSDQVNNACARIYELQLYNDQKTNIAFNNTATASEYYGSQTPAKAVNGTYTDTNDKWCTGWSTNPKWLKVDLGKVYTINKWRVVHAGAVETSHPEYNTRNFRLQKSNDGVNWENVDIVTGNASSLTERNVIAFSTRYVRLQIDQGQQDKDSCARIYEFQLYYD
ncbi:MAG TPA: discoidin domain-containing protein [Clostridia bacterium]